MKEIIRQDLQDEQDFHHRGHRESVNDRGHENLSADYADGNQVKTGLAYAIRT
jgi:hypothetical protein